MPVYFVDSSALVKRYRYEAGTERLTGLLDAAEHLIAARLAHVEVSAAIVRRGRTTGMSVQELTTVLAALDRDIGDSFEVVELDPPLIAQAVALTRQHGLRAADAIQLACALSARDEMSPQDLIVVGSDQELNAAASAEGLAVLDPTHV